MLYIPWPKKIALEKVESQKNMYMYIIKSDLYCNKTEYFTWFTLEHYPFVLVFQPLQGGMARTDAHSGLHRENGL